MTGIIAGIPQTPVLQRVAVIISLAISLCILNIVRVAGVFIAVSGRWFEGLADPTGTGDANFFWAHNVVAEILAVVFLFALTVALCRVLPGLRGYLRDIVFQYARNGKAMVQKICG